jgi:hypothetical protein
MRNKNESKAIIALKLLIDKESEIEELELYLAELDSIE